MSASPAPGGRWFSRRRRLGLAALLCGAGVLWLLGALLNRVGLSPDVLFGPTGLLPAPLGVGLIVGGLLLLLPVFDHGEPVEPPP